MKYSKKEHEYWDFLHRLRLEELIKETGDVAFKCMYMTGYDEFRENDCHWRLRILHDHWENRKPLIRTWRITYMDIIEYIYDCEFGMGYYRALEFDYEI